MNISSIGSANMLDHAVFSMNNRNPVTAIDLNTLSDDDAALLMASKEFEAYFLQMMFRAMRDTVDSDGGILPQSETQRIFQDMLDEHTARNAAMSGGMGLAQQIFRQMTAGRNDIQHALMYDGVYGAHEVQIQE